MCIIRNWWRPAAYNADPTVGGAKNGDHPTANAVDLDYASPASRAKAERFLRSIEAKDPWLNSIARSRSADDTRRNRLTEGAPGVALRRLDARGLSGSSLSSSLP